MLREFEVDLIAEEEKEDSEALFNRDLIDCFDPCINAKKPDQF